MKASKKSNSKVKTDIITKETEQNPKEIITDVQEIKTNDKKKISKHRIILTIVFIWALIGAILALPPAIPVVIILYIVIIKFPINKKEIDDTGDKIRKKIKYGGELLADAGKTGAVLTYHGGVIIKTTVQEFDKLIGGEEGYKRIIDTLGNVTERIGRHVVDIGIKSGKVGIALTKYTMKRIEQEMKHRSADERKLLADNVEYKILKNEPEFVNFVNMKDD